MNDLQALCAVALCPLCSVGLSAGNSWMHCIIYPGFAMRLVTCTDDHCMEMAEYIRRTAAELPRPRSDGFDQRIVDSIKERMLNSGRTPRAGGTLGASSGPVAPTRRD
jgi:hypothetical protein